MNACFLAATSRFDPLILTALGRLCFSCWCNHALLSTFPCVSKPRPSHSNSYILTVEPNQGPKSVWVSIVFSSRVSQILSDKGLQIVKVCESYFFTTFLAQLLAKHLDSASYKKNS